jgi:hypothetical protein
MWERCDERARLLDAQVAAFEAALQERADLPPVVPVCNGSAEEVTVAGRICCEGEGKLNQNSIFLEVPHHHLITTSRRPAQEEPPLLARGAAGELLVWAL